MKQLLRISIISLVGLYISYQVITNLDHEAIFEEGKNIFYAIIASITFLIIVLLDARQFDRTKKWKSFAATFFGMAILAGHFLILHSYNQRDNSPSQIYCVTKITDFNGISIDFRKDGTYKLTNWCLGADIYRGAYSIKDSIITIDKSKNENCIGSNRFVIRQDGAIDSAGKREKSIYQIDQQGQIIEHSADFRIIDDWKQR